MKAYNMQRTGVDLEECFNIPKENPEWKIKIRQFYKTANDNNIYIYLFDRIHLQ